MIKLLKLICCAIVFVAPVASLQAHEFWLDPESYLVDPASAVAGADGGAALAADVAVNTRIGENFAGSSFPYNPNRTIMNSALLNGAPVELVSRIGDRPALSYDLGDDARGLMIVAHQTKNDRLNYKTLEKFAAFVENKDLTGTLEQHAELGFPESDFKEDYGRYGKALIAIGPDFRAAGAGADQEIGLEVEIIALDNPYNFNRETMDEVRVKSLYQGAPRANSQIEVFERAADGSVSSFKLRTDAMGEVAVPVKPDHEYLVDAVKMRLIEREPDQTVLALWESLWASLTFVIPAS